MTSRLDSVPLPTKHDYRDDGHGYCQTCGELYSFGGLHHRDLAPEPEPQPHTFPFGALVVSEAGSPFRVTRDRYSKQLVFTPLGAIGEAQVNPPAGARIVWEKP